MGGLKRHMLLALCMTDLGLGWEGKAEGGIGVHEP